LSIYVFQGKTVYKDENKKWIFVKEFNTNCEAKEYCKKKNEKLREGQNGAGKGY
jgi:hypothetical protein